MCLKVRLQRKRRVSALCLVFVSLLSSRSWKQHLNNRACNQKHFISIVGKVKEVKLKYSQFNTATSIFTPTVWMYEAAAGNNTDGWAGLLYRNTGFMTSTGSFSNTNISFGLSSREFNTTKDFLHITHLWSEWPRSFSGSNYINTDDLFLCRVIKDDHRSSSVFYISSWTSPASDDTWEKGNMHTQPLMSLPAC